MALAPATLSQFWDFISNSPKWLFNASGDLVEVAAGNPPLQHDPVTGTPWGMVFEPTSENLFPNAKSMTGMDMSNGVTNVPATSIYSVLFMDNVILFDETVKEKSASYTFPSPIGDQYVGVSFFIKRLDGGVPVYGRTYFRDANISITMNGRETIDASSDYQMIGPLKDGSYWFRGRMRAPQVPVISISLETGYFNDHKDCVIGGLQIESNVCTSFIPTDGETVVREENWAEATLADGQTANFEQGTIDLIVQHLPGSDGAGMSMYHENTHMNMEFFQISPTPTTERYNIMANSDDLFNGGYKIFVDDMGEYYRVNSMRFAYSPYGNRVSINQSPIIREKDFNYLQTPSEFPYRITLGKSLDGRVMHGHVKLFKLHARAYTDDELVSVV